ncbi:MAG TPA: bifunctional nuclease family protein [Kofleriaceae bacterium]|nr:bifunctional nuclease family protein [Kofleriaceae bacterium]
MDPLTGVPLAILTDDLSGTTVPVGIGLGEASAIAAELDDIDLERPMTHQLMSELLRAAGARVVRVELREQSGSESSAVFTAAIALELAGGGRVEREARPSDALALALRSGAPIWVEVSVVEKLARDASPWSMNVGRAPVRRRRRASTSPGARASDAMPETMRDATPEDAMSDELAEALLDSLVEDEAQAPIAPVTGEGLLLEHLGPEAFGKWKM